MKIKLPAFLTRRKDTPTGVILIAIAETLWGLNIAINLLALDYFPAFSLAALKTLIGGVILLLIALPKWKPFSYKDFLQLAISSVIGLAFFLALLYKGQELSDGITSAVLMSFSPLLVYLFAVGKLKERFSAKILVGSLVSLAGIFMVIFSQEQAAGDVSVAVGGMLIFIALVFDAFGTSIKKSLLKDYHPFQLSAANLLIASIILIGIAFGTGDFSEVSKVDVNGWIFFLFTTLVSMVLAYVLYYTGLKRMSLERASVFNYLVPIVGVVSSVILLGDKLTPEFTVGAAVVFAGLVISQVKIPHELHLIHKHKH